MINGLVVELPNRVIKQLSERSEVISIHYDRPTESHMNRAAVTVGARAVQQQWGYDRRGHRRRRDRLGHHAPGTTT